METARPCIAVVDDEESIRKALRRLLRSTGMDVDTFPSGAEFLAALSSRRPDCLVLDLHMPEMNGFEVQRRLTQLGIRLPLIVITGHDSPETRARVLSREVNAYLLKPVDAGLLLGAIHDALARH
ncbi:MAG TPA: response regulator [Gammaproteobacteria bacterium]|nr:response regulator [Gammaproteobacteria bacterium]